MIKTFPLNFHVPEMFLIFSLLSQLLINTSTICYSYCQSVFYRENSRHTFLVLFVLAGLYFGFIIHDYFSDILYVRDKGCLFSKFIVTVIAIFCLILAQEALKIQKINFPEFHTIFLLALLSLLVIVDANDLLIFFLAMETQTICFYVLTAVNKNNFSSVKGGLDYFVAGTWMSAFFLLGVGFLYGCLGTINLADINALLVFSLDTFSSTAKTFIIVGIFLVTATLLFKIAAAPFHYWMPDVYDGAPLAATLIFSVLPKYSLFLFFIKWVSSLGGLCADVSQVLLLVGILSTIKGTLYALSQVRAKKLLIYSSIVQVGFLVSGLAVSNSQGFTSVIFFLLLYVITSLLVWGHFITIYRCHHELRYVESKLVTPIYISKFSDTITNNSLWILSFSFIFFSVGGIPPFAGFISKLLILDSLVSKGAILAAIVILFISSLSLFYYVRVLKTAAFEPVRYPLPGSDVYEYTIEFNHSFKLVFTVFFVLLFLLVFFFFFPNYVMLLCQYIVAESFKI